jgi:hypothetical protein
VTLRSQADAARAVHPPALARAAQPAVHGHASSGFVDARSFVPAQAAICLCMVRLSLAAR